MENETYKVNVTSHGLSVFFRNRVCRTPVSFNNVFETELEILKLQLKQKAMDFTVEKNSVTPDERFEVADEVVKINDEVEIEELCSEEEKEPESILDKLIADDK